jgi:thiol-disulfide isomerase/thioredoxin
MYIKNILFTLFALFTTISISQENNGWLVDYEEVYAKSIEQDKPIMANFTGSDWCGWCKKLKKAVFDTETFQKWAAKNVILFELDYPRRTPQDPGIKEQNRQLQQTFRSVVRGYPTVLIFDIEREYNEDQKKADGIKIHGKMGYMADPNSFTNVANNHISNRKK